MYKSACFSEKWDKSICKIFALVQEFQKKHPHKVCKVKNNSDFHVLIFKLYIFIPSMTIYASKSKKLYFCCSKANLDCLIDEINLLVQISSF